MLKGVSRLDYGDKAKLLKCTVVLGGFDGTQTQYNQRNHLFKGPTQLRDNDFARIFFRSYYGGFDQLARLPTGNAYSTFTLKSTST